MIDPLQQDNTHDERKQHSQRPLGRKHIPSGVKVWQVDPVTEIPEEVKATAARQVDKMPGVKQTHLKVEHNPELFYCIAINQTNALRKYYKSQFYAANRHRKQITSNPQ